MKKVLFLGSLAALILVSCEKDTNETVITEAQEIQVDMSDFLPTVAQLAGVDPGLPELDGISFALRLMPAIPSLLSASANMTPATKVP